MINLNVNVAGSCFCCIYHQSIEKVNWWFIVGLMGGGGGGYVHRHDMNKIYFLLSSRSTHCMKQSHYSESESSQSVKTWLHLWEKHSSLTPTVFELMSLTSQVRVVLDTLHSWSYLHSGIPIAITNFPKVGISNFREETVFQSGGWGNGTCSLREDSE